MDALEIETTVFRIIQEQILDFVDPASLNENSSSENVLAWDSLAAMRIALALEEHYGLQFTMEQIGQSFVSVKAIRDVLRAHGVESDAH